MNDLISRQWLMECVNEGWIRFDTEKDENRFIYLVRDIAPSAQPEPCEDAKRSRGEWREHIFDGIMGGRPRALMCTHCNVISIYASNFCPNCGADMRGEQDDKCRQV